MQQEKTTCPDNRLRKKSHKKSRSTFVEAKTQPRLTKIDAGSTATPEQRSQYYKLMKNGKLPDNHDILIGSTDSIGKDVIVDPKLEQKRRSTRRFETAIITILVIMFSAVLAITAFSLISDSTSGDKLLHTMVKDSFVSDSSVYQFGEFEGFVTVGDSFEKAIEILGLPEYFDDGKYYYGRSYIIVENNTVVGYMKNQYDSIRITIGFKDSDEPIVRGDSARRVVKKLGAPDYCYKRVWIYLDINKSFASTDRYSYDKGVLTLNFNEDYLLEGYVFNKALPSK